jgi:butyryl-CoA dehydrogenase
MFQMMNEARINIGLCAAAIANRGYLLALDYARSRAQGRLPSCRDASTPQVKLIEHADVRRLLLAQKAYAEGALAMSLYGASLAEDQHTHPDGAARRSAALLLDLLTPVIKSWPSRYGGVANDHAIQVLGGSGYTREYLAEQLYRDQRLNPIHEGAEAIHALDLLGRKAVMNEGAAYRTFRAAVDATLAEAAMEDGTRELAAALATPLARLDAVTAQLAALQATDPDGALANASVYLDAFGRIVAAWIWLRQALAAQRGMASRPADAAFYRGKLQAARYMATWELPATGPQFDLLAALDRGPFDMQDAWF